VETIYLKGHLGLTATLYVPFGVVLAASDPSLALGAGVLTLACGLAPDIDSYVSDRFLEHRGLTHTVGFAALVGVVGAWMFSHPPIDTPALGFALGVVGVGSHLVADWLNPMGIAPWYPVFDRRYSIAFCNADDPTVNWLLLALGGLLTLTSGILALQGGEDVKMLAIGAVLLTH
jgi:inner membrane protein